MGSFRCCSCAEIIDKSTTYSIQMRQSDTSGCRFLVIFAGYDSNTYNTSCFGHTFRKRKGKVRPCGDMRSAGSASVPGAHSGRGTLRILEHHGHNDGGSVHCRRWNLPDRSGKHDRQQGHGTRRQKRATSFSSGDDRHLFHRHVCQQYGYGGLDAPYRCQYGCGSRHVFAQASDASCIRQQHGRNDDAYRYAAQPYRQ